MIALDDQDGKIDRAKARTLLQQHVLMSPKGANWRLDFADRTGPCGLTNRYGRDLVAGKAERAGSSQAAQWRAMEAILSEPTLPEGGEIGVHARTADLTEDGGERGRHG